MASKSPCSKRTRVGGRVLQQPDVQPGRITEEGAELIGSFHTKWLGLAREYGLAMISRMEPDLYQREGLDVKLTLDKPSTMDEFFKLTKEMKDRVLLPIAAARETDSRIRPGPGMQK